MAEIKVIPTRLQHSVGADIRQDQKLECAGGDGVARPQIGDERSKALVRKRGMAAPAEPGRGVEAHRFQIVPAGGIVRHRYA